MSKIYCIGICGTGMASLAAMLKTAGNDVTGSDENVYPPMSTFLAAQEIPVNQGYDAAHLTPPPDIVIIGNALSRGNPEVERVLNDKLPFYSMPEALRRYFLQGKYSCVVTGTHGKTTTSSMLAWALERCGMQPSFFVGGLPENFERGYQLGRGKIFVIEGDEYDTAFFDKGPKFLHYAPDLLIINNIEYDHADIYENVEEVKKSFRRVINIVPGNGHVVANADDACVRELIAKAFSTVHTFGLSAAAQWRATAISVQPTGTSFQILHREKPAGRLFIPLFGDYNVCNALAVYIAATLLGAAHVDLARAFQEFKGVRRRMSLIAEAAGNILIFDDFAHHATAVRQTLAGARARFPKRRIWAIFEPRTASAKRKVFEQFYYTAFDNADCVVIAPLHRPDKVPAGQRLSVENIIAELQRRGKHARILHPGGEMLEQLRAEAHPGDVFIFMSNGDFASMPALLAKALGVNGER